MLVACYSNSLFIFKFVDFVDVGEDLRSKGRLRILQNMQMERGESLIFVQALRILNSLMTSFAIQVPCFIISSFLKDSSTLSSFTKFICKLAASSSTFSHL